MTKPNPKIDKLLADLRQQFGENKIMRASEIPVGPPVSTGSLALDLATGYGGFPSNRVVEIYGRPGTGKTTLALTTMLNALAMHPDKGALFMDVEHKLTKEWMAMIVGEDVMENRILYVRPTSIENATNIYRQAVESGSVCCAILDSIGGAPTVKRNEDAEVGHYGGNAMGVGAFARTAGTLADVYDCLTIGINQVRANMGMGYSDETPGGHQWKHTCVLRVELVRGKEQETIKLPGEEKPVPIGNTVFAMVRKNQVGAPGRTAHWWFFHEWTEEHGFGIDQLDEINRLAIKTQVVKKSGGWYYHPALPADAKGERKVQGIAGFQKLVREDESLRQTIVSEVMASLKDFAGEVAPISDPDAPVETELTGIEKLYLEGGGTIDGLHD